VREAEALEAAPAVVARAVEAAVVARVRATQGVAEKVQAKVAVEMAEVVEEAVREVALVEVARGAVTKAEELAVEARVGAAKVERRVVVGTIRAAPWRSNIHDHCGLESKSDHQEAP